MQNRRSQTNTEIRLFFIGGIIRIAAATVVADGLFFFYNFGESMSTGTVANDFPNQRIRIITIDAKSHRRNINNSAVARPKSADSYR